MRTTIDPRPIDNAHPHAEWMRARVSPRRKLPLPDQADSSPKLKCERLPVQTRRLWRDSSPRHDNAPRTIFAAHAEFSPVERSESKDDGQAENGTSYPVRPPAHTLHGGRKHWVDR